MVKKLLFILVAALLGFAIATWGSIGSTLILAGIVVGLSITGYRAYLENREDDWYA